MIVADKTQLNLDRLSHYYHSIQSNLSAENNFLTIDRLFICTTKGSEAVSLLQEFGLFCPNTIVRSDSQGTLSRMFFFENAFLALVWLEDDRDRSDRVINFAARANWQDTRTSPFGIGLSRNPQYHHITKGDRRIAEDLVIDNYIYYSEQNQKNILEPFIFMLPERLKYSNILDQNAPQNYKYTNHPLGLKRITNINVMVQEGKRRDSEIVSWLKNNAVLNAARAFEPLLEITFDRGSQGKVFDARPTLPIIFKY
jgi:hypothetical protein